MNGVPKAYLCDFMKPAVDIETHGQKNFLRHTPRIPWTEYIECGEHGVPKMVSTEYLKF